MIRLLAITIFVIAAVNLSSAQNTDGGRERTRNVEVNNDALKTGAVGKGSSTGRDNIQMQNNTVNETPANRSSQQPHNRDTNLLTTEPNSKGNEKGKTPKLD